MNAQLVIEIIASVFGVVGTLLLATRTRWAGFGFVAFLASNCGWLAFSYSAGLWFMFWQQVIFTCTSLLGFWVWVVKPMLQHVQALLDDIAGPTA